jgi:hypothetical protein
MTALADIKAGKYGKVLSKNDDGTFTTLIKGFPKRNLKIIKDVVYVENPNYAWNKRATQWKKSYMPIEVPKMDFFTTETGIAMYDSAMQNPDYFRYNKGISIKVQKLSPMTYIQMCAEGRTKAGQSIAKEIAGASRPSVSKYAYAMLGGDKFPVPSIEYHLKGGISQEGRHRALAVQKLIDDGKISKNTKIPVVVVKELPF